MDIILGLDVSTQCIGLTLASSGEEGIKILQVTHFRLKTPKKIKGIEALFNKSSYFENVLKTYRDLSKYNTSLSVNKVVIEEPLISSNNSETASTLLRFNGMISQSVYHILGVIPEFISSYDARKYSFPDLMAIRKYNKTGEAYTFEKIKRAVKKGELVLFGEYPWDCVKKFILWNKVSEMYPDIKWVYGKDGELTKENFDASDSLICVMGYVNKKRIGTDEKASVVEWIVKDCGNGNARIEYRTSFGGFIYSHSIDIEKEPKNA